VNGENIYAFRSNCSYRHHFEKWFSTDAAVPGKIFEMESYHGMRLRQRRCRPGADATQHAASMPGSATVSVWPLAAVPLSDVAGMAAGHGVAQFEHVCALAGRARRGACRRVIDTLCHGCILIGVSQYKKLQRKRLARRNQR
jgi:hypothetical protein